MSKTLLDKWVFLGVIMADPKLPSTAKSTAYHLLDHLNTRTGRCDPSQVGLAERTGVTERATVKALNVLFDAGYFEREKGGGRGHRSAYRPRWEIVNGRSVFSAQEKLNAGSISTEQPFRKTLNARSVESGNINREETGKEIPPPTGATSRTKTSSIGDQHAEAFERFFTTYPSRRPHSNPRKPAEQKFTAAVKRGVDPETIIRGATNYARYIAAERTDPKYVAQAVTWLKQERWTEYQDPPKPAGPIYSGAAI